MPLFANQCSPIRSQADVLVDTLHCKTEQRRTSVLCQLGVQLAASRPIEFDIVRVISLIHRSICQSRLRSQPVRLANYFANKATILAKNAHTVMIQQKVRYQNRSNSVIWKSKIALQFLKIALQ